SGITVSDSLLEAYEAVKLKSANKFLLFTLEKVGESGSKSTWDWKIVEASEKDGDNKERWEEMTGKLPEDEARFVVFDFQDTKADGRLVKKLVLIKWCPDTVHFRTKPIIGASYQTLKNKLDGIALDVEATDFDEIEYETIKKLL
ncbi:COF1, partial [Symbiodinium sp. KB8]